MPYHLACFIHSGVFSFHDWTSFNCRLFEIAPDAAVYFSNTDIKSEDFQAHIHLVMSTLNKAVQNLENLTELRPALERLGAVHAAMGVRKEQLAVSNASSTGYRQSCFPDLSLIGRERSIQ